MSELRELDEIAHRCAVVADLYREGKTGDALKLAIVNLRALLLPEEREPVAWDVYHGDCPDCGSLNAGNAGWQETTPCWSCGWCPEEEGKPWDNFRVYITGPFSAEMVGRDVEIRVLPDE